MTANNRILGLAATAALLASAPAAHATLAVAAPFEQKVDQAASIIVGKCVKTESRQDPSGRWILTYSTFQVEKSMKGALPGTEITVVTPGGRVGSTKQDTIGIPEFREGDENVLFIKNSESGPTVLYFDQGAYDVTTNDRGDKLVAPVQSTLVKIDTQRGMAVPDELPRTLDDFAKNVDDTMAVAHRHHMEYDMLQARRHSQTSIASVLLRYKYLIAIAVLGAALATWQLLRR